MVEQAIVALLVAAGTLAGDRVEPLTLPRDPVLPAISYQRISTPRGIAHNGDQGYAGFRIQVNCWAQRIEGSTAGYFQAKQLANEVRVALNGFRGTAAGIDVGLMHVSNDHDESDPERSFERVMVDVSGSYQETTA